MNSKFGWYERQSVSPKGNTVDTDYDQNMKAREEPQKVLEVLQKSRKGRIHYDTGWDTQPFSMLKLISEVQAEDQRFMQRNLERAVLIVEQSESNREESRRASYTYSNESSFKSPNTTQYNLTTPFYTANNTLTSPDKEIVDGSTLTPKTPKANVSLRQVRFIGIPDDYDEEADAIALAAQSPIFAQYEKLSANYEQGRIASWLALCREKVQETAEIGKRFEAKQKETAEKARRENDERRRAQAKEREAKRLELEKKITEHRRRLELESKMQEQELNRMRQQQVEKEKLDLLEAQKKKDEEEAAKILAQEEAAKLKAEAEERAAKVLKEKNDAAAQAQAQADQTTAVPPVSTQVATAQQQGNDQGLQRQPSEIPPEFIGAVLESDLKKYVRSQQLLDDITSKIAHISSTAPRSKTFYFAAMKVVNTPLNAISNLSPSHLQTKINHFYNLLDGKPVYVGEMTTPFLSSSETDGNLFILNLLAYRFVKKSEAELTKGDKTAGITPLATLGAHLARRYPQWSEIVRAYFYKLCPFLVPFNYPRKDMTIQQYAVAIGQDVSGNERAVQQVMLERIGGYSALYALMVVKFEEIGGDGGGNEFFTLYEVWRILSAALKVEPQLDVTATVLHTILETIGDKLATTFNIQFRKYLQQLTDSYLTKISGVTPPGKAAALTRLKLFLEPKAAIWFR